MSRDTLLAKASAEIVEFHRFFVAWYNEATAADTDFSRCERVFAEGFHMIPPSGAIFGRTQTVELLRSNKAKFDGEFAISIEDIRARWQAGDAILVTYIEFQQRGTEASRRLATALFTESPSAPCGVQWQHLQETWLQMPET